MSNLSYPRPGSHPRRRVPNFLAFFAFLLFSWSATAAPLDPDFDRLERALRLRPAQKEQFEVAVAATQRALFAVAMSGLQIKERVAKEFAKPLPDLNTIYDIHEQVIEQNKPLFREARDAWSKLFTMLDDEQVAITKRYIEDKLNVLVPK